MGGNILWDIWENEGETVEVNKAEGEVPLKPTESGKRIRGTTGGELDMWFSGEPPAPTSPVIDDVHWEGGGEVWVWDDGSSTF